MRSKLLLIAAGLILATACDEPGPKEKPPSRFAAVKKQNTSEQAARSFCEKRFPAGQKPWSAPPSKPFPGLEKAPTGKRWKWINLWASWCGPCLEELPLLSSWKANFEKERVPLDFEMWSVDEETEPFLAAIKNRKRFPGVIRWLRGPDDLPVLVADLGVEKGSGIPIHALVDPQGSLRCVRVGSVGPQNLAAIKAMVTARN